MRKEMYVALAAMLVGCGGGGSSASSDNTAGDAATPTSLGQYAGTYHCAATSGSDEVFVAVLPTPTGAFSSCSGSVDSGTESITCTGSISATGNFVANKVDVHGVASTNNGTVSGSAVTGTFSVPAVGVNGATFACKHTG